MSSSCVPTNSPTSGSVHKGFTSISFHSRVWRCDDLISMYFVHTVTYLYCVGESNIIIISQFFLASVKSWKSIPWQIIATRLGAEESLQFSKTYGTSKNSKTWRGPKWICWICFLPSFQSHFHTSTKKGHERSLSTSSVIKRLVDSFLWPWSPAAIASPMTALLTEP